MGEYLGQEEFQIAIGPARVAYLIRSGSVEGFRRAVQEASTRWGGVSEPIIPVTSDSGLDKFWIQTIECANVDEFVNVDVDVDVAKNAISGFDLPLVPIRHIDRLGPGQFTCHPSQISHEETKTYLSFNAFSGSRTVSTMWTYAGESLDLWALTAAGSLTSEASESLLQISDYSKVVSEPMQVFFAQIGGQTGLDRSSVQFQERWTSGGPYPRPAIIWLCDENPLDDCLMYWNLRALRPLARQQQPMILLPAREVDNWLNLAQQINSLMIGRPDNFSPDAFLFSTKISHERLRSIGNSWGMVESKEEMRIQIASQPPPGRAQPFTFRVDIDPSSYFFWNRRYGIVDSVSAQVFRDQTNITFPSPVSFWSGGRTRLNVTSDILKSFPQKDRIAQLIHPNGRWHDGGVDIPAFAQKQYKVSIHVPELSEAVEAVLKEVTKESQLSDKGRMGESIMSIADISQLLQPGVAEVIQALTTRRTERQLVELLESLVDSNMDFERLIVDIGGRMERRSQSVAQLNEMPVKRSVDLAGIAESLVGFQWAERGYRVTCSRCGITSFIDLVKVSPRAVCPGCQSYQQYERSKHGPTMYYRLNSLIDRASDQGVIPHLLIAAYLKQQSPNTYILPGLDVIFSDETRNEVDLFGIYDSKVISGEVKTSSAAFSEEQISRDIKLSSRLQADLHIMACMEKIPLETMMFARTVSAQFDLELVSLDPTQMRPVVGGTG